MNSFANGAIAAVVGGMTFNVMTAPDISFNVSDEAKAMVAYDQPASDFFCKDLATLAHQLSGHFTQNAKDSSLRFTKEDCLGVIASRPTPDPVFKP